MKEQFKPVEQSMRILDSDYVTSIPLAMFNNFRDKLMLYYGRSPERLATHRGLTVKEALEIFFTSGTMPPKKFYESALQGEVNIYDQLAAEGKEYGPPVYTEADYKDCHSVVFKGPVAHLKYMKTVNRQSDITRPLPQVLYYVSGTDEFFSYDFGVAINRTKELRAPVVQPMAEPTDLTVSPLGQMRHRVETLFDAIKHGDEDHQGWLKEAIRCHFAGEPMPQYVAGKSKVGKQVEEFFQNLQAEQTALDPEIAKVLGDNMWELYEGEEVKNPSAYIHRPDEPFFVLLGRDPQAPDMIETWANLRELAEPGDWKIENARQTAKDMRVFKVANPHFGMPTELYEKAVRQQVDRLCKNSVSDGTNADTTSSVLRQLYNEAAATLKGTPPATDEVKQEARPEVGALADVAINNPDHLPLALQLVDAQPCPQCNFIHTHCRCLKAPSYNPASMQPRPQGNPPATVPFFYNPAPPKSPYNS